MPSGLGPPVPVPVEGGSGGAKAFPARKRRGRACFRLGGLIGWTIVRRAMRPKRRGLLSPQRQLAQPPSQRRNCACRMAAGANVQPGDQYPQVGHICIELSRALGQFVRHGNDLCLSASPFPAARRLFLAENGGGSIALTVRQSHSLTVSRSHLEGTAFTAAGVISRLKVRMRAHAATRLDDGGSMSYMISQERM